MKKFTLIKTNFSHHVSMDLYKEFEGRIAKRPKWDCVPGLGSVGARIVRQVLKVMPPFIIPLFKKRNYVVIGYQKEKFFPYFQLGANSRSLWMYDAWEPLFGNIEKTIRQYNINVLFTASKQSADYFNTCNIKDFKAAWVPEGIDVFQYKFCPYSQRGIDVLQLGRRWEEYHGRIQSIEKKYTYKYELRRGEIIFKTREDFINGLANSKISICVPSNITHPEYTGQVSTLTNRYLQSMASRCLILGKMPYDMQFLFDYNPIVEIDEIDPVGQIENILSNFDSYIPLIEKNYTVVKQMHSWDNRINLIERYLDEEL